MAFKPSSRTEYAKGYSWSHLPAKHHLLTVASSPNQGCSIVRVAEPASHLGTALLHLPVNSTGCTSAHTQPPVDHCPVVLVTCCPFWHKHAPCFDTPGVAWGSHHSHWCWSAAVYSLMFGVVLCWQSGRMAGFNIQLFTSVLPGSTPCTERTHALYLHAPELPSMGFVQHCAATMDPTT
jgi:hypothetical protein